jgi:V/A-type H+-transporting ATPase subunit E
MSKKPIKQQIKRESGVNELIARLRKKGVEEGKNRAEEIINDAEFKASKILDAAKKESEKIILTAEKKAQKLEQSVKESIKIAFRDSTLELKEALQNSFIKEVKKIVNKKVSDKHLIKDMILKIVETSVSKEATEILIADKSKEDEKIKSAVYEITKAMLKDTFELKTFASMDKKGIIVRQTKKGIDIELTDEAISDLLLEHMLPIYRNILEGEL